MNDSSRWTTLSLANVHTTNTISFVPNAVIHFWPPASIAKMLRAQVASPLKVMANLRTTMSVSRCIKDIRIARSATSGFGLRNARSARASFATACKLWKHLAGNTTGSASVVLYVSSTLASWRSSPTRLTSFWAYRAATNLSTIRLSSCGIIRPSVNDVTALFSRARCDHTGL